MATCEVVRTYLQLESLADLRRTALPPTLHLRRLPSCSVATSRALYRAVGEAWHWHDRDAWPDAQLAQRLARPAISIWLLEDTQVADAPPLGYAELEQAADGAVEICYFGLVPAAIGRGLGAGFLSTVSEQAFALGATRVWLHTCTLDHPAALANYEKRGFVRFRRETYVATLPDAIG